MHLPHWDCWDSSTLVSLAMGLRGAHPGGPAKDPPPGPIAHKPCPHHRQTASHLQAHAAPTSQHLQTHQRPTKYYELLAVREVLNYFGRMVGLEMSRVRARRGLRGGRANLRPSTAGKRGCFGGGVDMARGRFWGGPFLRGGQRAVRRLIQCFLKPTFNSPRGQWPYIYAIRPRP